MTRSALAWIRPSLAVLAALAFAAPANAQSDTAVKQTLSGIVVDATTGTPLVGVWLGIDGSRSQAYTDRDGRFAIHGVQSRGFTVSASQLGYKDASIYVEAIGDEPMRIELQPDPIVLQGIRVVSNRLAARRNAIATSVRAYGAAELATSPSFDAYDFMRARLFTAPCPALSFSRLCVRRRGSVVEPVVFVDDARYIGGFDVLLGWDMQSLYSIEVIASGMQIRIYTKHFAERLAQGKARLMPVIW